MLESFFAYLCVHSVHAHYTLFVLLLLAGVNIPVSEDLILILGGVIVSVCVPDHYTIMFIFLYLGCIISAYEAYWLGHHYGHKLYETPGFRHIVTRERIHRLKTFMERYGLLTFVVGRFIPGGMRNAIFITSGMARMPFPVFVFRDGIAALISTFVLFQLGYIFGRSYPVLFEYVHAYHHYVMMLIGLALGVFLSYIWYNRSSSA